VSLDEAYRLQVDNDERIARLAKQGVGVDQGTIEMLRFRAYLEVLLGDQLPEGLLRFQQGIAEALTGVESQVTRAKLLGGGPNGPR